MQAKFTLITRIDKSGGSIFILANKRPIKYSEEVL